MKIIFLMVLITGITVSASDSSVPKVKKSYTTIKSEGYEGKRFSEIIPANTIQLIALTKLRGKGSPIAEGFAPDWDSDELIQSLLLSDRKSEKWKSDAYESCFAEYTIVSSNGLFFVEIYGSHIRKQPISGIGVRGDGFGCWFTVNETK